MNCAQAEEKIYVYRELTPHERVNLDRHVSGCATCKVTMARVATEQATVQRLRGLRPPAPNHSRMTERIMGEVLERQQARRKFFYSFRAAVSAQPLRYAMATFSLILIATFAVEYNSVEGSGAITKRVPGAPRDRVVLNSASFFKSVLTEKEQTTFRTPSIYACMTGCGQTAQGDCADCEKFSKF